jgi:hypothetical protein
MDFLFFLVNYFAADQLAISDMAVVSVFAVTLISPFYWIACDVS